MPINTNFGIYTLTYSKQKNMYQPPPRQAYLHQWDIRNSQELPLQEDKRKMTDICCLIVGVIFGLVLFIIAICMYNRGNLAKTGYPTDSNGNVCELDTMPDGQDYPFLYFNDINDPTKNRYCVDDCPVQGVPSKCYGDCSISYYPNYPSDNRLGAMCLPEDNSAKQRLLINAGLDDSFNAITAIKYLLIGLAIAFGLAIFWFIFALCLPKIAVWVAVIAAAVLLLATAIIFFLSSGSHLSDGKGWAIFLGVVCVLLMLLIASYICFHSKQLKVCGAFLEVGADCIKQNCLVLLYIPLFIALTFLFGILTVFQYLAFASESDPNPPTTGIYYTSKRSWILMILLVIQTIWGLSFFRDCFNYIVSGIACNWYFQKEAGCCQPFKWLICRNIGSVVGGSFLSALFYFPNLLISFLCPQADCCFCNFFDLARSDVYAYIYLTGNSYCPSSRHAQYLSHRSQICRENESAMSIYAFAARIVIALSAILIVWWITKDNLAQEKVPPYLLLGIFFICLYIVCYFVDVQVHAAEAVMICFHTQYELEEGWTYKQMPKCPKKLTDLITDIDESGQTRQNNRD